jgi:hypothetical protein
MEFCGAALAIGDAVRINARAVPARIVNRTLCMNAYSTGPGLDRGVAYDALHRNPMRDISS